MGKLQLCCCSSAFLFLALAVFSCQLFGQEKRPSISGTSAPQKVKHPKTIDDLEAIGIRNITGSRLANWYSLEREIKLGQEYSNEIEGFTKPLRDPFISDYVNRIGQKLVRNSDAKVAFSIKVIDSEEVNAFALPGGFMYVNSGLLLATEDEAELAGIMAHEIAHVAARHATRQITRSQIIDFASLPLIAFGGGLVIAARETVGSLGAMKFARSYEAEADYLGLEYLYKAGYDPTALISILERLRVQERPSVGAVSKAFASHPQYSDRIRRMQKEIACILPARPAYVVSTSDFDEVRSRLLSLAAKKLNRTANPARPILRRRGNPEDGRAGTSDGAPVLNPQIVQ